MRTKQRFAVVVISMATMVAGAQVMPAPAPIPPVPSGLAENSLTMQPAGTFTEVKMDFPIAAGPYEATWESIAKNYPGTPAWLREAKFGVWVHFGPQAAGQSGDWYARKIYQPDTTAYANHIRDFGHPSDTGYMDVLHTWNPKKLDPAGLVKLYKEAGARFLIVQGVHHDNFDNWNSTYQPWNAMNMGPKRDLLGEWSKAAKAEGMRYGVSFHHEYTWWWYQPAFGSDATGPKAGLPYDAARLTLADGKGKWWEGYDPRLLYGVSLRAYQDVANVKYRPEGGIFQEHLEYANWYATRWSLRIMDVINKYDPDFIYTDGDSTEPFSGDKTGTGYKCDCMARVIADFYNKSLERRGKVDVFSIVKFHPPANGVVSTVESKYPKDIKRDQDWIGENAAGDWFYKPDIVYSAPALERYLLEEASRDGSYAVNIPLKPDGSPDEGAVAMLREMGKWMKTNGEGIYGSKAWAKFGEGEPGSDGKMRLLPTGALNKAQAEYKFEPSDWRFTVGRDGAIYAFEMQAGKPGSKVKIQSLGSAAMTVKSVSLLGSGEKISWKQTESALEIVLPRKLPDESVLGFRVE